MDILFSLTVSTQMQSIDTAHSHHHVKLANLQNAEFRKLGVLPLVFKSGRCSHKSLYMSLCARAGLSTSVIDTVLHL